MYPTNKDPDEREWRLQLMSTLRKVIDCQRRAIEGMAYEFQVTNGQGYALEQLAKAMEYAETLKNLLC